MEQAELEKLTKKIDRIIAKLPEDYWEKRETWKKAFKKLGFNYLASGVSRFCYLHESEEFVLKVANEEGEIQGKTEIQHFLRIPERLKPIFAKILIYDKKAFRWSLMEYAEETYDSVSISKARDVRIELKEKLAQNGFQMTDLHEENVGKRKGKPVIIDYGCSVTYTGQNQCIDVLDDEFMELEL